MKPEEIEEIEKYEREQAGKNAGLVRFRRKSPDSASAFLNFWRTVNKPGSLDRKTKELIALAITLVANCKPCVIKHTKLALEAGCTEEEIMEAASIALAMGGAIVYEYIGYMMEALEYYGKKGGERI